MLRHDLRAHPVIDLRVAETGHWQQGYGFAAAPDTARLSAIDTTLLRLQEAGRLRAATERWLGP
jgi:ABC-type amino acid transport substrate-binding protein